MMDFTLNVRGVMMPMGAAAYVSTNFLHKKEHIARNLLRVLMGYSTQTRHRSRLSASFQSGVLP